MKQFAENLIAGFGITDIIDILLVAFIFYKVLGFVRESRAEQLLKGVLLLLAAAFLSDLLHLYTLNWILRGILTVGILALIILFQPELRRALEHIGRGKLFRINLGVMDKEKAKDVVEEFVEAVENMAASRTGALIVFQREISLEGLCETGTVIDAGVTSQLIENIFYEGSPLHDGAIIVQEDRLHAAGCVLPLTEDPDLPKSMGTRHRAGIGVTETSDAIAVVVSEETGIVSLARDGVMERYLDGKTLEKRLLSLYLATDEGRTSVRDRFFRKGGGA